MRVAMLVATTYNDDSRVRRAAEQLANDGCEIHVVCLSSARFPSRNDEVIAGVHIHRPAPMLKDIMEGLIAGLSPRRHPTRGAASAASGSLSKPGRLARLGPRMTTALRAAASPALLLHRGFVTHRFRGQLRALQPEVVHTHDADTLPAAAVAVRRGARLVHDAHELTSGRPDQFWWERQLDLTREARWLPRAAAVITVSEPIARILAARHGIRVIVIRNVPAAPPAGLVAPVDLRAQLSIPWDRRLILHQGMRAPDRGLRILLRAAARVPDIEVVLLGSAVRGMDSALDELADELGILDRVHLIPPVPSHLLLTVTRQADVGVVLTQAVAESFRLSLPNKLFEYLAVGVPVIASDLPAIAEVVHSCRGGRVVDPTSVDAVTAALRQPIPQPRLSDVPTASLELAKLAGIYGGLKAT